MDVGQTQHYKYQETVSQALVEVEAKVSQLQHFKEDYEALHQVLTELPLKTQCPVMVPFGPLGFMPGHLVHTNEIIVLLGDDWYVERSAFQAKGMVQRRIQEIEGNLSTLTTQCENLQARTLSSTSTNPSTMLNEEGLQMVDICEPYIEPSPPPSSPSLLHESTSLRYLNPHDLTYTLSTEDQDYLSSVFDPYEDEYETSDDDEKSKRVHQQIFTPTPPPKVLEPTRPSLPPMSKGKSLKKVTFSTPVSTTQEMIEHPLDDVHATLSIHPITSSNSKVKDVSLPPVSDKVIERDTSMEDQKLMQEEIEKQVEYQQAFTHFLYFFIFLLFF
ncbi:hypothetical protein HMI54_014266 [Coelomomyces lativittatus]|nr:hypothetical protein HMI54_014266 [Coelomomyces lativittatus]